jgi:uncharacterized membrane protein YcfT
MILPVYVPHAILVMIIVLKLSDEVMNHYVLSCQLSIHSTLCTFTYFFCHYPYHNLMVQVILGRWCAHILATSPQDMPESSNARAGAATNELHNAARGTPRPPPPPLPPLSIEQLMAT